MKRLLFIGLLMLHVANSFAGKEFDITPVEQDSTLWCWAASWCHAQDVPAEIIEIINNYSKDSTAEYGFLFAKKWLHLSSSAQLKDIKIGKPIQEFGVKYSALDTCSDTVSLNEIIEAKDSWHIPIMIGDQPAYELELRKKSGNWRFSKMSDLPTGNMWDQLRFAYPESSGIKPVLVVDGLSKYFYFKQKGPRKIYYIRSGYQNDSLEMVTPGSISALSDSKKLIQHWKKQGKGSNNTLDKVILRRSQEDKNGGGR